MSESLVYERAYARIGNIIDVVRAKRNIDAEIHNNIDTLGSVEKPDKSIDIVIQELQGLQRKLAKESNRLWQMAEMKAEFYDWAFEKLANAVVVRAVEDYEIAISGYGNKNEQLLIEKFAERCDRGDIPYTNLSVASLLKMVQEKHKEFEEVVRKDGLDIIAETKETRATSGDLTRNTHRCPLCGGALYSVSQLGMHRIYCTGCQLSGIVLNKKKKQKTG